ncbi:pirin family protein [Candidatus Nitrotoga arctica]
MEDWFPVGVFDHHPHRGIETLTYVIDGVIDHYDNHGNKGTLHPGDVPWMAAGRGLIHNEQPAAGLTVHSLQLGSICQGLTNSSRRTTRTSSLTKCRCVTKPEQKSGCSPASPTSPAS